jgi:hypothetical protein
MTNNKQQSAVELFAIALYQKGLLIGNGDWMQDILDEFKEIFKEQIMEARRNGSYKVTEKYGETRTNIQYYNETYGDDKQ